jgi:hypothetical protein
LKWLFPLGALSTNWGNAKSANAAQPKQGTVVIFMSPHHSESVYNVDTF